MISDDWFPLLLLVHGLLTAFMTGVIWLVQLVHYPLFDRVQPERFAAFAEDHQLKITPLVGPVMGLELLSAVLLMFAVPSDVATSWLWVNLGLLGIIWGVTFGLELPLHQRLAQGFDPAALRRLIRINWIRTVGWSLRTLVLLLLLHGLMVA